MTKEKFSTIWNEMDDEMRCRWLSLHSNSLKLPEYKISIDNDSIFLSFKKDRNDDEPTLLYFDEFGYNLILSLFHAIGVKNAELV